MSQLVDVKTKISDLEAVKQAAESLGLTVQENARARYYNGMSPECELVVKGTGRYDLGLKLQDDGTYKIVSDNEALWGNFGARDPLRQAIGENAGRLLQEYGYYKMMKEARKKGITAYRRQTEKTGVFQVVLEVR